MKAYKCEDCIGMLSQCGMCYCAAHGCVAPCTLPIPLWKRVLLWTVGLASGCVLLYLALQACLLLWLIYEVFYGSR